jgi:hypothetical protein
MAAGKEPAPGGGAPMPGPPGPQPEPPGAEPPPAAVRACSQPDRRLERLSHAQFTRTVRELLGDTSAAGQEFPADPAGGQFANNADRTAVSPLLTETYEATVGRLVEQAWTRDERRLRDGAAPAVRTCPLDKGAERTCASRLLTGFARRAWRRDLTAAETAWLLAIYDGGVKAGAPPDEATRAGLRATLLAPDFLFRVNRTTAPDEAARAAGLAPLDDFALATRLSYFAWGTTPDAELLDLAAGQRLRDPAVYDRQVQRLLGDARSEALVDGFLTAWLGTDTLAGHPIDAGLFPALDGPLRAAMARETAQFTGAFLREDLDARGLLDARFTFLDDRLARHYGLPAPGDKTTKRVELANPRRGGLLTHGSVLTITSPATRTSPVMRGRWVLERLLCVHPPEPPGDVDTNPPPARPAQTLRARLEQHRLNPACAGCHDLIDPYGFGLETYDAIGAWRDEDNGARVDASGVLLDGRRFDGPQELARLVKEDPRFAPCVAEHAYRYAVGRDLRPEDQADIDAAARAFAAGQYRLRGLLASLARSRRFTHVCAAATP